MTKRADLIIQKKNEVFCAIDCEPSIKRELYEFFAFRVPGYQFIPAYRNKLWDGFIRLYNLQNGTLYNGLLAFLGEFCNSRQYTIEHESNDYFGRADVTDSITPEELHQFAQSLDLRGAGGKKIQANPHQLEAAWHALRNYRALLVSPTASGKSLIIYLIISWYLQKVNNDKKVLIVVPTTSLVEQMVSDFGDYSVAFDYFDADIDCHKIYSGKEKETDAAVVVTTWQSVYKQPKQWFMKFGMVIGDEAHTFKAKSLTTIMESLVNAKYRVGTTGTLDGTQTHELVLQGLFGPTKRVITTKELQEKGILSDLSISMLVMKYSDENCKIVSKMQYKDEIDFIVTHEKRRNFVANLALAQDGNTLVLYNLVQKHGIPIYEKIKQKIESKKRSNRKIFFVSGATDVEQREQIRAITEKENDAIIVASLGTFSTGINIRNLHNIIFASPSKSQIKVLQSIGRGLRKSDDGRTTKLFDIVDDLHWKSKKNYTLQHGAERMRIYNKEQFEYSIHEVPIE